VTPQAPATLVPDGAPGPEGQLRLDSLQQDKLSLIGHMASSIAHELSNPLATIVASAQSILSFWPRQGAAAGPPGASRDAWSPPAAYQSPGVPLRQLREDLELILEEARRAGEIVHGLLASARQDPPEWRICSVADVLRRTVGLCRHHLKLHNVSLQAPYFDPHDGFPLWSRVRGDANQLQQVLLNLIINAQQAITASRGYGTVRVTLAPQGADRVILTVEDDGPGVPEEQRETIFRPFYTTKPAGQGTGLGLSISAEIVRAHGGKIRVEPHEHGGAVFRIELPSLAASERTREPAQTPGPDQAAPEGGRPVVPLDESRGEAPRRTVLLVDDEAGVRTSLGRFLGRLGYHVTEAPSAEAALVLLNTRAYDAIISDLRMPGLSGEEFFALLQQQQPQMVHRVIFTSGDTLQEDTRQFLARCGRPSLQKPFEMAELIQVLGMVCPLGVGESRRATA